jgi:O-antigen ligase
MVPLKSIVFLMTFFGMSAGSLLVPVIGVANYMLIYQISPQHTWWHIHIAHLGIRYSLTAALCMMFGLLINMPRMRAVRPILSLWDLAMIGLVLTVVFSEITGLPASYMSAGLIDKFVKMMIFIFCLTRITTDRRNFEVVLWVLVIGSLYIGYDAWTAPRGSFSHGRLEFVGGPDFRHSSGLSAHMSAMLPLIGVAVLACKSWKFRIVGLLAGALTVNTIILCRTRSAFVGLACGAVVAVLIAPKHRRLKTYGAIGLAALCANLLTDNAFWDRMATLNDRQTLLQEDSSRGRLEIWVAAGKLISEYPLGVGVGNFEPTMARHYPELGRRAAHNTFVLCWTELGLQGLTLFLFIVGASIIQAWQCLRRADQTHDPTWTRNMAYGLMLSLAISIGTQMFTERLYTEAYWWVLALPGCLKRVVILESATRRIPLEQGSSANVSSWSENNPLLAGGVAPGTLT